MVCVDFVGKNIFILLGEVVDVYVIEVDGEDFVMI